MPNNYKISYKKEFAKELKSKINWIIKYPTAGTIESRIYSKQN